MAGGRPTIYTDELAALICEHISSSSKSLRTICKEVEGVEVQTILSWLRDKPEFLAQYTRSKQEQAQALADEIIAISDDAKNDYVDGEYGRVGNSTAVQRSKLMIDSRKWIASKLLPKKYGDKIEVDNKGKIDNNLTVTIIRNKKEKED